MIRRLWDYTKKKELNNELESVVDKFREQKGIEYYSIGHDFCLLVRLSARAVGRVRVYPYRRVWDIDSNVNIRRNGITKTM